MDSFYYLGMLTLQPTLNISHLFIRGASTSDVELSFRVKVCRGEQFRGSAMLH